MIHTLNIIIHVVAGTLGLVVGILAILNRRKSKVHVKYGRLFVRLIGIVVATGFLGWVFFRSNSFLLMLTLLSGYVTYAGVRSVRLRENKATSMDATAALAALLVGVLYLFWLKQSDGNWAPSVIYSTLGALVLVTVYDLAKFLFFHPMLKACWLYEHIYKMVSAFSALLSAFVGTVLPGFKPYSQVGPSIFSVWLIVFLIWQESARKKKAQRLVIQSRVGN